MIQVLQATPHGHAVDCLTAALASFPAAECPVIHRFTPGLYVREASNKSGTVIVSRVHKTEHPFVLIEGRVLVWSEDGGSVILKAPYVGITKPGTRRVLAVIEDCRWMTFHPTQTTDVDKLQDELTETPDVSYATGDPLTLGMVDKLRETVRLAIEESKS